MARRRSKKTTDAQKRPAAGAREAPTAGAAPTASDATPARAQEKPAPASGERQAAGAASAAAGVPRRGRDKAAPQAPAGPGTQGRWVRLSTCVAGMVLTLVLGLYLGTLLPGVLQDMRGQGTRGHETAAATAPPAPGEASGAAEPKDTVAAQQAVPPAPEASVHGLPPELAARLAALEAAVRKDPASADNWTELGNLFFDAGRVREAITAYERSLALVPGNADVLTDLGIMYRENKAPEKAVECFRKALAAEPRHENALFNAGVVLYTDLGRREEAVAAWRRLLAVNPQARAPDGRTVSEMVRRLEEPPRRQ